MIGRGAFSGCESLERINIPSSVTSIGARTFYCCIKLTSVKFPKGLQAIEDHAFFGCDSLKCIYMPYTLTDIGGRAFWHCTSLMSIDPVGLHATGKRAFSGCIYPIPNLAVVWERILDDLVRSKLPGKKMLLVA